MYIVILLIDYTSRRVIQADNRELREIFHVQLTFFAIICKDPRNRSRWCASSRLFSSSSSTWNYEITRPRGMQAEESWPAHRCHHVSRARFLTADSKSHPRLAEETPGFLPLALPCIPQTFLFRLSTRARVFISRARKASECLFFPLQTRHALFYYI